MDVTAVTRFLESLFVFLPPFFPPISGIADRFETKKNRMETPAITGAILIDSSTGLCLGAAGHAKEEDAAVLAVASREACDEEGVGAVKVRGVRVVLRKGKGVLVGIFRE
jgi:hypothetical protein